MNKERTVWEDTSVFLVLKRSQSRILVSLRRQNVALIHSASRQWSEVITEVNPNETSPSSAWWRQAEIENHAACKSDFLNMSLAKYAWIQSTKKNLLPLRYECATTQRGSCCTFYPHLTETSIKCTSAVKHPPLVFPQFILFRVTALRCVHFEARLQIDVMTSSRGSLSFI